jgi:hypothetical protein
MFIIQFIENNKIYYVGAKNNDGYTRKRKISDAYEFKSKCKAELIAAILDDLKNINYKIINI